MQLTVLLLSFCAAVALSPAWGRARLVPNVPSRSGGIAARVGLAGLKLDTPPSFNAGEHVRVRRSLVFKHVPKRKEGFDAVGCEGVVVRSYVGSDVSANKCAAACPCPHHICSPCLLYSGPWDP